MFIIKSIKENLLIKINNILKSLRLIKNIIKDIHKI